ncbi:MAG: hypothetical protein AUG51_11415 [Acidobacteria bacterium 13_1_20CM_3_53_8]|nr:MAG: hypothetical protein AUG51_11415 [Acidobacteria bacterium 13_1_20CM_3_53_8]
MEAANEQKREQILALREQRVETMLNGVRALHCADQVPIAYAVDRLISEVRSVRYFSDSRLWYQRYIIRTLSQDLQILKVRNRWMCSKGRADAMDFKLWFFCRDLEYEI